MTCLRFVFLDWVEGCIVADRNCLAYYLLYSRFRLHTLIIPFSWQCCKIPRSKSCSLHNCCIPLPICYDVWGLGSWNLPVAGSINSYSTWKQAQYPGKKSSCVINKVTIEGSTKNMYRSCVICYAPSWIN